MPLGVKITPPMPNGEASVLMTWVTAAWRILTEKPRSILALLVKSASPQGGMANMPREHHVLRASLVEHLTGSCALLVSTIAPQRWETKGLARGITDAAQEHSPAVLMTCFMFAMFAFINVLSASW